MNNNEFNITNSKRHNVRVMGAKDGFTVVDLTGDNGYNSAFVKLVAGNGTEVVRQKIMRNGNSMTCQLQGISPGHYELIVMKQSEIDRSLYYDWLPQIPTQIGHDRMVTFDKSPVYDSNVSYYGKLKTDHATLEQYKLMPRGNNADIIRKAYEITGSSFTDYAKALAIHDWIADNIYYDLDSYHSGHIDYSKLGSADKVFNGKLAVCAGYSDLAVIMLRAVGIPAFTVSCYALGLSTEGKWTSRNVGNDSNHAITLAYMQKRWVIMDITWDSGKAFENGRFQQTRKTRHRYFDPTLQSLSGTHKLCA